jgi:hypothetical protein
MCSAGLPFLCRPYRIGNHRFLDGGLEANLPAGFILTQGAMSGRCIICIIPSPVGSLSPEDHVSYRTLSFLVELKRQQAYYRGLLLRGGTHTVPSHTMYPVLIVSPQEELKSGLVDGFLRTDLLPREFEAGRAVGESLVHALANFMAGDDDALNGYLLEYQVLPDLAHYPVPRPGLWALWVNPRWLE